jgi:hypothetical protein
VSLLSLVQTVTGLLSLPTPGAVAASADRQVIQLMAIANEEGLSLARRHAWQALTAEASFVTVNANVQTPAAPIPPDFDRFVPNSFFNRTTRRPMTGPISPREWQWIMAQPVYSTVYLAFRERTGQFLAAPAPPAGQAVYYEYVSKNWAHSSTGVAQSAFLADGDTALLDETLIQLGLRWRFLKAKGLDYAEDMQTYEREVEQAIARDGGSSMLSLSPQPVDLNRVNLPDGSFGV